ncbi:MAG: sulfotransferase [Steroidobacteraceae bacterium]
MASLDNTRMPSWTPPERPEWVKRANEEGSYLDLRGVVPLEPGELIDRAIANTGLKHFGDDDWREPFDILVKSLDQEANLSLMGRLLGRSDLLMFLDARLQVEAAYKEHPEIEEQKINKPLWVLGQGRSGTTLLHTLLAQPPANRTTTDGMAVFPLPQKGMTPQQQHELADKRITQWNRITPQVVSIHEFGVDRPCETFRVEAMGFRSPAWLNLLGSTPSYNEYIAKQGGFIKPLEYCKRVLKVFQWADPGRQWILRSNHSLLYLPDVIKVFPDVRFVWSHRDPVRAMASMVDMIGTMMWIRSDQRISAAYEFVTNPAITAGMMTQPVDWLESGAIPKDRMYNVLYKDLVRDAVGTVENIYQFYDLPFTDETRNAIAKYVKEHPRDKRPSHRYGLGREEQIQAERQAFKRYQDYFGVPNET